MEFLRKLIETLSKYDTDYLRDLLTNLSPQNLGIVIGVTFVIVVLALLKKMVRTAVLIIAVCATITLVRYAVPPPGESITLAQIIALFIGGSFITSGTIYFLFIRTDF
jgi:hypothetical protein